MKKITILSLFIILLSFFSPIGVVFADESDPKNFEDWRQISGSWSSITIGSSNVNAVGCYLVSMSIIAKRSGHDKVLVNGEEKDLTPGTFVNGMKSAGGIDGSGALYAGKLTSIFKDNSYYRESETPHYGAEAIKAIDTAHKNGNFTIVHTNATGLGHYMAVQKVDVDKQIIYVYDPANPNAGVAEIKNGGSGVYNLSSIDGVSVMVSSKLKFKDAPLLGDGSKDSAKEETDTKSEEKVEESKFVGEDAWKNKMVNFQNQVYKSTFKGIDTGSTGFINSAFISNLNKTSQKVLNLAYIAMMFITIGVFLFMFTATIVYLVILPNGLGGYKLMDMFEKTTGLDSTVTRNTTFELIGRLLLTTLVIACLYANLLPIIISGFIQLLITVKGIFI